jgi:hypothetical protein
MEEKLIKKETAKLAREVGFDIECRDFYSNIEEGVVSVYDWIGDSFEIHREMCKEFVEYECPTQSLLQKWLRDTHNIHIYIKKGYFESDKDSFWYVNVMKIGIDTSDDGQVSSSIQELEGTFEEVLEVGLLEALKIIK